MQHGSCDAAMSGLGPVLTASKRHFRSTPNNGHHQTGPVGPFGARSGQSTTASAAVNNVAGNSSPSDVAAF